eukprot:5716107-Alexandrium_andersonii.AAC.1
MCIRDRAYTAEFAQVLRQLREQLEATHAGPDAQAGDPRSPPSADQLWQATVKCIGKAPGPDGWVAQELLALPEA